MKKLLLLPTQEAYTAILKSLSLFHFSPTTVLQATSIINQIIQSSQTRQEITLEIGHANYLLEISQRVKKFNFALETYDNFIRSGKLKPNADTCLQILKI